MALEDIAGAPIFSDAARQERAIELVEQAAERYAEGGREAMNPAIARQYELDAGILNDLAEGLKRD